MCWQVPKNPYAHLELGTAAFRAGKIESAERELRTAYRIGGAAVATSQLLLGQIYYSRRQFEASNLDLEQRPLCLGQP